MVRATKGVLVVCDAAMKQFLLFKDKELHFIIRDLDETRLLIDESKADLVLAELDRLHEENTYVPN
jgi:TFIIH basal transcription factor complex TTD-A subunit